MLEFPLNQLQTYYGYLCDLCPLTAFIFSDLNYTMPISLSQTESTPKHFFLEKKNTVLNSVKTIKPLHRIPCSFLFLLCLKIDMHYLQILTDRKC
jgi:hypothetical protein